MGGGARWAADYCVRISTSRSNGNAKVNLKYKMIKLSKINVSNFFDRASPLKTILNTRQIELLLHTCEVRKFNYLKRHRRAGDIENLKTPSVQQCTSKMGFIVIYPSIGRHMRATRPLPQVVTGSRFKSSQIGGNNLHRRPGTCML